MRRYASWPFFKGLVDLVEIEIAKADPSVSALYDAQCCAGDAQLTALGQARLSSAAHCGPARCSHASAAEPPPPPPCPLEQELRLKLAEAVEVFLAISGKPELLAEQPRARAAALARRPYLNGLHAIQGEAMGRLRKAGQRVDSPALLSDDDAPAASARLACLPRGPARSYQRAASVSSLTARVGLSPSARPTSMSRTPHFPGGRQAGRGVRRVPQAARRDDRLRPGRRRRHAEHRLSAPGRPPPRSAHQARLSAPVPAELPQIMALFERGRLGSLRL